MQPFMAKLGTITKQDYGCSISIPHITDNSPYEMRYGFAEHIPPSIWLFSS
jgi:hypothetical protein